MGAPVGRCWRDDTSRRRTTSATADTRMIAEPLILLITSPEPPLGWPDQRYLPPVSPTHDVQIGVAPAMISFCHSPTPAGRRCASRQHLSGRFRCRTLRPSRPTPAGPRTKARRPSAKRCRAQRSDATTADTRPHPRTGSPTRPAPARPPDLASIAATMSCTLRISSATTTADGSRDSSRCERPVGGRAAPVDRIARRTSRSRSDPKEHGRQPGGRDRARNGRGNRHARHATAGDSGHQPPRRWPRCCPIHRG